MTRQLYAQHHPPGIKGRQMGGGFFFGGEDKGAVVGIKGAVVGSSGI